MNHSDPTANAAIGAVNREWKQMVRLAIRMRNDPALFEREKHRFLGIYRRLLTDPPERLTRCG
jgi:hypothetical protein